MFSLVGLRLYLPKGWFRIHASFMKTSLNAYDVFLMNASLKVKDYVSRSFHNLVRILHHVMKTLCIHDLLALGVWSMFYNYLVHLCFLCMCPMGYPWRLESRSLKVRIHTNLQIGVYTCNDIFLFLIPMIV